MFRDIYSYLNKTSEDKITTTGIEYTDMLYADGALKFGNVTPPRNAESITTWSLGESCANCLPKQSQMRFLDGCLVPRKRAATYLRLFSPLPADERHRENPHRKHRRGKALPTTRLIVAAEGAVATKVVIERKHSFSLSLSH